MGVWEKLRLTAGKPINRTSDGTQSHGSVAVPQISNAVSAVTEKKDDGQDNIRRVLKYLADFTVNSAVHDSLKGVAGGNLVDKIVKEGSKDQTPLRASNQNDKPRLLVEEMRARLEKMQEDMDNVEPQTTASTQSIEVLEPHEHLPEEPAKGLSCSKPVPQRVMIRSRL